MGTVSAYLVSDIRPHQHGHTGVLTQRPNVAHCRNRPFHHLLITEKKKERRNIIVKDVNGHKLQLPIFQIKSSYFWIRVMGVIFQRSSSSSNVALVTILFFSSSGMKFSMIRCLVGTTQMFKGQWNDILNYSPSCRSKPVSRAGYCSKMIPIPWVRYRFLNDTFFNTNFMKSVLTRLHYLKKHCLYFVQLVDIYTDSKTHLLSHCTKGQNISNTINQCK